MNKVFLHVDLDAFFASVEYLDHPEWLGKPLIVGGKPEDRRSVVSTASYEARKYGVHSAMPTSHAYRLCPQGIYVYPRMQRYLEKSLEVMEIFNFYSPDVQQISIDEAFIDITGTEKLFGTPVEIARKIKNEVFTKTGLTVSVGVASVKYVAKIASEMNKPDGLFIVPPGQEENFMINLPLEKMWGVGTKSLERLHQKGIHTTKAIHEKSLSLLISLFGNSSGHFLYNAVRGQEYDNFNTESRHHSLSAENTYPWDLTDSNAIETALLELSQTVIFRMKREKLRSRCISLKIRYDDFSTVTAQCSLDSDISSVDDFYERIKQLFYTKYDNRFGIRLLGAGLYNTESSLLPSQGQLFDFGENRKKKVEQAILNAEDKIPGIKITKARLLTPPTLRLILCFLFTALIASVQQAYCSETKRESDGAGSIVFDRSRLPEQFQNSTSLFNYKAGSNEIKFNASGWWKTFISGKTSTSFGYGTTPGWSPMVPVLNSQVELNLLFFLNKTWFFQADFADDFDTNTIAAGYYGNGILKEAKIASSGISFPAIYSLDELGYKTGGGTNQAPGVYAHLEDLTWQSDIMLRYETTQTHSKSWIGKNSVSSSELSLSDYLTGWKYQFPDQESIFKIKNIYVESATGSIKDSKGRKYKKLDSTQYLLSASDCAIYLSKDANAGRKNSILPAVLVEFESFWDFSDRLGSYGTGSTGGTGFLGEIQEVFSVDLKNRSIPEKTLLNGTPCYFIQYPGRFSPFAVCSRYDAGIKTTGEAAVIYDSSKSTSQLWNVILNQEDFLFDSKDFFYTTHSYADVVINSTEEKLSVLSRFPFAETSPEVYTGGLQQDEYKIAVKSYSPVTRYDIGTKAVPGTVIIYKNGIQDAGATYSSESGTITLSTAPASTDRIYVIWNEDSSDSKKGNVVLAAGYKKTFSENFSGDISIGSRWTTSLSENSNIESQTPGYVMTASSLTWKSNNFSASNIVGAGVFTASTTNSTKLHSIEKASSETVYLDKNAGVELSENVDLYLNIRNSQLLSLKKSQQSPLFSLKGVRNSEISGYAVPLQWDFTRLDSSSDEDPFWSSASIKLNASGSLSNATKFSVALLASDITSTEYDVYLQLGGKADDSLIFEDTEYLPVWKISTRNVSQFPSDDVIKPFVTSKSGWQTIEVRLTDQDRQMLADGSDMRLIIVKPDNSANGKSGIIYAGPYETDNTDYSVYSQKDTKWTSWKEKIKNSKYSQSFDFDCQTEDIITISKKIQEFDLTPWKSLNISLNYNSSLISQDDSLTIIMDRPEEHGQIKTALKVKLDSSDLSSLINHGSSMTDVYIDLFNKTSSAGRVLHLDANVSPVRIRFILETKSRTQITLSDITLKGISPYFTIQDKGSFTWKHTGTVFSESLFSFIKNPELAGDFNYRTSFKERKNIEAENTLYAKINGAVELSSIKLSAETGSNNDSDSPLSFYAHNISTVSPLFKIIAAGETVSINHDTESFQKENNLFLDLKPFFIPVTARLNTQALKDSWGSTQTVSFNQTVSLSCISADFTENFSQNKDDFLLSSSKFNLFDDYKTLHRLTFDNGYEAKQRKENLSFKLTGNSILPGCSPFIKISSESTYKNKATPLFSDQFSRTITIPISTKKNSFSFSLENSFGQVSKVSNNKIYSDDIKMLKEDLDDNMWFIKTIPFYDLWDKNLKTEILRDTSQTTSSLESKIYSSTLSAGWKRPFTGTFVDFYTPSSTTFALQRDIKTSSSSSDLLQLKTSLGFNAFNIFGKTGVKRKSNLFNLDEYFTSITAVLKFPERKTDSIKTQIDIYHQNVFYIKENVTFKSGIECSWNDTSNNNEKLTLIYSRPGKHSPVSGMISFFKPDFSPERGGISRIDSINLTFRRAEASSSSKDSVIQKILADYNHQLDVKLNKYAEINTSAGLNWDVTTNQIITLSAELTAGATIRF